MQHINWCGVVHSTWPMPMPMHCSYDHLCFGVFNAFINLTCQLENKLEVDFAWELCAFEIIGNEITENLEQLPRFKKIRDTRNQSQRLGWNLWRLKFHIEALGKWLHTTVQVCYCPLPLSFENFPVYVYCWIHVHNHIVSVWWDLIFNDLSV